MSRRSTSGAILLVFGIMLAGCSGQTPRIDARLGVAPSPRVVADGQPIPRGGGRAIVGRPYTIGGRTFVPRLDPSYSSVGVASWYGDAFHGRLTANGEIFDRHALSAAHPTMPLPSYARVTNLENGRSVILRVNDRGPFAGGERTIDVSRRASEVLGFRRDGLAQVRVDYVGPASLAGSDDRLLLASLHTGEETLHAASAVHLAGEPAAIHLASARAMGSEEPALDAVPRGLLRDVATPNERVSRASANAAAALDVPRPPRDLPTTPGADVMVSQRAPSSLLPRDVTAAIAYAASDRRPATGSVISLGATGGLY
ncbi:septal ring lytic transglycosylase RlpA family protein [Salinarimonas ramus]|uniref:Endolytic peptidoglycan transglycosylase RlpA n=1 Tax=Salinarimonas ramus TaxID=690164 RepID=A0A917QL34_9HYPH|nr:septal ring lytic transglycosylase RlpA family protein [Salinarimonas ramus]GGK55351.1 hypothetical protein GCM10011322_47500 [Salinarimonas ramus]